MAWRCRSDRARRGDTGARRPAGAVACAVAAGLLAGVLAEAEPARRRPSPPACAGVIVRPISEHPDAARDRRRGRRVFSLREVQDLGFEILLAGRVAEDTSLEVRIITPHGHLYQQRDVPVAASGGGGERTRRMKGYRFPLKVAKARPAGRADMDDFEQPNRPHAGLQVVAMPPFPVAGTLIETHSLYGRWRIEARVEGGRGACRADFRLTE